MNGKQYQSKQCLECGQTKPLLDFYGRNPRCKECCKKASKAYYRKHKEEILKRQKEYQRIHWDYHIKKCREYRRRLKLEVLTHYGGNPSKCACCGELIIDFLTIDHIDGGGRKHRENIQKSGYAFYNWLKRNNFPEGFQVLCYNCNQGRAWNNGICPHKTKNIRGNKFE